MNKKIHFTSVVQDKALELLKERSIQITIKQISEDTKLTEAWLSLFIAGGIKQPSAGKVEALYNYLSDDKLKV